MPKPKRILVIDDEESVRDAFSLSLRHEGYQVETAVSGEEGLERFASTSFDVVFLDLRMPGIDGVETLNRIRAVNPDVPVFIVTAFRSQFMERLADAAHRGLIFNVVDKPLTADQIRTVAHAALGDPQIYSGPEVRR